MKHTTRTLLTALEQEEDARLAEFGPPPVNVFKELREAQSLSHQSLAMKCYVSKLALIRLEQGCFSDPLPSVIDYYVGRGESELRLRDAYIEFQQETRRRHYLLFGSDLTFDLSLPLHPLRQLRRGINPTDLSKRLCLPQATIEHFEKKWKTQQSVPKQLASALSELGYRQHDIEGFKRNYKAWRELHSG